MRFWEGGGLVMEIEYRIMRSDSTQPGVGKAGLAGSLSASFRLTNPILHIENVTIEIHISLPMHIRQP